MKTRSLLRRISAITAATTFLSTLVLTTIANASGAVVAVAGVEAILGLILALGWVTTTQSGSIVPSDNVAYLWDAMKVTAADFVEGPSRDRILTEIAAYLPEGLYYTNGSQYYIDSVDGLRPVTSSDGYIKTTAILGSAYTIPLNIAGLCNTMNNIGGGWTTVGDIGATIADVSSVIANPQEIYALRVGKFINDYGGEYWASSLGAYTYSGLQSFWTIPNWITAPETFGTARTFSVAVDGRPVYIGNVYNLGFGSTMLMTQNASWKVGSSGTYFGSDSPTTTGMFRAPAEWLFGSSWVYDGRSFTPSVSPIESTILLTEGVPATSLTDVLPELKDHSGELDDTYVNVKPSPDPPEDDDDDEKPHWFPFPPEVWELFEKVADIIDRHPNSPDSSPNKGTTLGDYVNNNYNYNEVYVEAPEIPDKFSFYITGHMKFDIDADVTLGGNITVNINVDENLELPSVTADDGGNWNDLGVVDVVADITIHNPVFPTLKALFDSIDPFLRALFLSSVGLSILVGLWKLIRG